MTPEQRLDDLRELLRAAPIAANTRWFAILSAVTLLCLVLWLVRRRALREEQTPIWVLASVVILVVSVWLRPVTWLMRLTGAWSPASMLVVLALFFLVAICLHYAVRLSRLTLQVKNLSQEIALLRSTVDGRVPPEAVEDL